MRNAEFGIRNDSALRIPHSAFSVTLVELLVVLAVMGMLIALGAPALTGYANTWRLKTTTRQLVGLLSLARSTAISTQEEHAVELEASRARVRIINEGSGEALDQALRLPAGITMELRVGGAPSPESRLVFRPNGALAGRTTECVLANRQKEQTITVMSTTGALSLE